MFVLKSKEGHVQVRVHSEAEKDRYINSGFNLVSSDGESVEETLKALDDETVKKTVEETTAPVNTDDDGKVDFNKMKVDELKAYASEHNIEIKATLKADIIAEIVSAEENAQQLD